MVTIRKARLTDREQLTSLDTYAPHDPSRAEKIVLWIEREECWLAQIGEAIVGYGVLSYSSFGYGLVEMLMVGANYRRRGVGAALVSHLSSECNTGKLWATTNESNRPMRQLLATQNFIESGIIFNLDDEDPELVFLKR